MYDTVIIGAGMSGLAAGIRLAHYDQKVCILERHTTIGGLNSFYRLGGRDFDVGLHAVTNFTPKGARKGPLARLLRQLRFRWDDFALAPQIGSEIAFPQERLQFGNEIGLLESEIARAFPAERDAFATLMAKIVDYDDLNQELFEISTREFLAEIIRDPLLIEMLLCPLMWYGNARERDMDFGQFCIMFRSIFCEGFGRPFAGVRLILKNLIRKFRRLGGELKTRAGVDHIHVENGRAIGLVLDNGQEIEATQIISSAGLVETMRLCDDVSQVDTTHAGRLSFMEAISVIDVEPQDVGLEKTVIFFNDSESFSWERPDTLIDARTGVICSPNNYAYTGEDETFPEGMIRITAQANFDRWNALDEASYQQEKIKNYNELLASAVRFIPDFRHRVIATDIFTPTTIRRFTGHDQGTVYGATHKTLDGSTHLPNLHLCGTDQGFIGIVGSMMGGISIANHCLSGANSHDASVMESGS